MKTDKLNTKCTWTYCTVGDKTKRMCKTCKFHFVSMQKTYFLIVLFGLWDEGGEWPTFGFPNEMSNCDPNICAPFLPPENEINEWPLESMTHFKTFYCCYGLGQCNFKGQMHTWYFCICIFVLKLNDYCKEFLNWLNSSKKILCVSILSPYFSHVKPKRFTLFWHLKLVIWNFLKLFHNFFNFAQIANFAKQNLNYF